MRTDYSGSGRWLHTLALLKMHDRFESLYPEGYEERLGVELTSDLIDTFGPVSEGRYERGPFTVDEPADNAEYHYWSLPDEFMAEHLASLARLGLADAGRGS